MILGQAYGSAKLAVPTPMAEAPAINISMAASALSTYNICLPAQPSGRIRVLPLSEFVIFAGLRPYSNTKK